MIAYLTRIFGLDRLDLAEDVVQDTLCRALEMWPSQGVPNNPSAWLMRVARNRAIDLVRKRGEASLEDEPQALEIAADTPDPLARREMNEELKRLLGCVGKLEPERQRLVLLAYYNGWSREQLAAKFDTPVNTVKTWLRRSMLEIRECLGMTS